MASYYYLISSLPMLRAGDAPPLDYAAFLDQCRGAVSDRVYRSLEELTVRSEDGGFVSRWAAFYRVLDHFTFSFAADERRASGQRGRRNHFTSRQHTRQL